MHNEEQLLKTHNTARFFTETRHVAWVLLIATMLWGVYGYMRMPQRKDPDIPIRQALALCAWPGSSAEKIEQLVTRRMEEKIAENVKVDKIESNTRTGITAVFITLVEGIPDTGKEFDDIKLKLDTINDLPDGAGPINFVKDFGDTSALMLTVSGPRVDDAEIALRAKALQNTILATRAARSRGPRVSIVQNLPATVPIEALRHPVQLFTVAAAADGVIDDATIFVGSGFIGVDAASDKDDATIGAYVQSFIRERVRESEFHPDAWGVVVIRDPKDTQSRLTAVAGDKYSYRELDD